MHRRHVLGLYMAASFASLLMAESSFAQQPLKDQLVGAWTLVSVSSKLPDGSPVWGLTP